MESSGLIIYFRDSKGNVLNPFNIIQTGDSKIHYTPIDGQTFSITEDGLRYLEYVEKTGLDKIMDLTLTAVKQLAIPIISSLI